MPLDYYYSTPMKRERVTLDDSGLRRFLSKVNKTQTCWIWKGAKKNEGSKGVFCYKYKIYLAHRLSYMHFKGALRKDWDVSSTCNRPHCVRPDHLCAATRKNKMSRIPFRTCGHPKTKSNTLIRSNGRQLCKKCYRERTIGSLRLLNLCKNGHRLSPGNTYVRHTGPNAGKRACKKCSRKYQNAWWVANQKKS